MGISNFKLVFSREILFFILAIISNILISKRNANPLNRERLSHHIYMFGATMNKIQIK